MASRPRSLPRKKIDENTVTSCYCRRCMKTKLVKEFYVAVDDLDRNGYMSICKSCCNEIFDNAYAIEHSLEKALLRTCKTLNIAVVPSAVDATRTQIAKMNAKGITDLQFFSIYKGKLSSFLSDGLQKTFVETEMNSIPIVLTQEEENSRDFKELQKFWGKNLSFEQIEYLENEFAELKASNPNSSTRAQIILLREACFLLLKIKEKRSDPKSSVDQEMKSLQELFKSLNIRPDQATAANSGNSKDAFGVWIKDIEETTPAEWWKDQGLYKDVDNIEEYWKTHILRPFLNFWGVQKDFNFEGAVDRNDLIADSDESEE